MLQDVAFNDLHALVEFIYHGEVNVHQRSLSSFLKTAEVLRVSGLTQQQAEETHNVSVCFNKSTFLCDKIHLIYSNKCLFFLSVLFWAASTNSKSWQFWRSHTDQPSPKLHRQNGWRCSIPTRCFSATSSEQLTLIKWYGKKFEKKCFMWLGLN